MNAQIMLNALFGDTHSYRQEWTPVSSTGSELSTAIQQISQESLTAYAIPPSLVDTVGGSTMPTETQNASTAWRDAWELIQNTLMSRLRYNWDQLVIPGEARRQREAEMPRETRASRKILQKIDTLGIPSLLEGHRMLDQTETMRENDMIGGTHRSTWIRLVHPSALIGQTMEWAHAEYPHVRAACRAIGT